MSEFKDRQLADGFLQRRVRLHDGNQVEKHRQQFYDATVPQDALGSKHQRGQSNFSCRNAGVRCAHLNFAGWKFTKE
jgi:hypothetical protein